MRKTSLMSTTSLNWAGLTRHRRWLLAGAAMLCLGAVNAAGLEVNGAAFQQIQVKAADGSTFMKTVPVATVVPGTEVTYVITYRNSGEQPAADVVIDNPVPAELEYIGTADGLAVDSVSVDGGQQYGTLSELTVTADDGALRPAQTVDVTHLRWTLETLAPGAEGKLTFVAKVK